MNRLLFDTLRRAGSVRQSKQPTASGRTSSQLTTASCYSEGHSYGILRRVLAKESIRGCCQCCGIEELFNRAEAARKLRECRRGGPARTTQLLLDALMREPVAGQTVLDIGGGVGAILHALLKAGAATATDVDASAAYLAVAREEAARQGHAERIAYHHGNFVDIADTLAPANIVTLDRVICCYHHMLTLVERSSAKAARLYGLVYPRDTWWVCAGVRAENALMWLQRSSFRMFAHSSAGVDAIVRRNGFQLGYTRSAGLWQVVVYERHADAETTHSQAHRLDLPVPPTSAARWQLPQAGGVNENSSRKGARLSCAP